VVAASAIILLSQNFWAVTASQIATSLAGAAIVPAVTGLTLGLVKQRGFNHQIGRNQAFNHAGNLPGGAASGYLGWCYGYGSVFLPAVLFGAISIACVLMIPDNAIDHRAARGTSEDDPQSRPSGFAVLLEHKPLLALALALAIFHLGTPRSLPYTRWPRSWTRRTDRALSRPPSLWQGVMVIASLVAMRASE